MKSFRICWVINLWQYQFNSLTIYNSYNCITAAIIIALIIRVVENSLGTQSSRHGDCKTLMFQSCLSLLSSPNIATLAGEKTTKQFNALMIMMYEQLKTTNKSCTCVVLMFPTPRPHRQFSFGFSCCCSCFCCFCGCVPPPPARLGFCRGLRHQEQYRHLTS